MSKLNTAIAGVLHRAAGDSFVSELVDFIKKNPEYFVPAGTGVLGAGIGAAVAGKGRRLKGAGIGAIGGAGAGAAAMLAKKLLGGEDEGGDMPEATNDPDEGGAPSNAETPKGLDRTSPEDLVGGQDASPADFGRGTVSSSDAKASDSKKDRELPVAATIRTPARTLPPLEEDAGEPRHPLGRATGVPPELVAALAAQSMDTSGEGVETVSPEPAYETDMKAQANNPGLIKTPGATPKELANAEEERRAIEQQAAFDAWQATWTKEQWKLFKDAEDLLNRQRRDRNLPNKPTKAGHAGVQLKRNLVGVPPEPPEKREGKPRKAQNGSH
jgi:hypothetical protein